MAEEKKEQAKAEETQAPVEEQAEAKAEAATETATAKKKTEEKPKVQLSAKLETIVKSVEEMTVLELSELVKAIEDKFGVSAAAPVAAVAVPGAGAAAGEAEEKSVFSVVLASVGSNKIQVIKEIRA
ncbi:MAG: hypothetical protein WBB84_08070, partial [Candidatus Omnitrophota bacterium]